MDPLISVSDLKTRIDDPGVRIADVRWYLNEPGRGRREYEGGHLPGAIFIDLDKDLAAPSGAGRHPLPEPTAFARRLGELGFGSDDVIMAYDDVGGAVAARLWWMLDNLGHPRVALLDGGMRAWQAAGLPLTTDISPARPALMELADGWSNTLDRDALVGRLGAVTLLDARAPERYRGEVEPVDSQPGHIPTAVNAPARLALGQDGRFLAPAEIAERYVALAPSDRPTVASCGSGVTACHTALAFRVAGLPDPLLYPGSYSDWSGTDMPVATGDEPGRLDPDGPRA